jgi:hypothetical protein
VSPNGNGERILLARRASGQDHGVVFGPDALRIEGGFALRRRIPYRSIRGLERAGAWLWLGAGFWPAALGGRDVAPAKLDTVEAELRARVAALPGGERRLAAPRAPRLHRPWLSLALASALAGAGLALAREPRLALATDVLLLLAVGLVAERWLGRAPLVASGAAGLLAGGGAGMAAFLAAPAGFAARALCAAWIGLLAFARLRRAAALSVLARSAFDATAAVALAFGAHALASGASPLALAAAALAGSAVAPLVLRHTPH